MATAYKLYAAGTAVLALACLFSGSYLWAAILTGCTVVASRKALTVRK